MYFPLTIQRKKINNKRKKVSKKEEKILGGGTKYDLENPKVRFYEEDHRYVWRDNPDKKPFSVTTVVDFFVRPFDENYWLTYKAFQAAVPNFAEIKRKLFPGRGNPPAELFFNELSHRCSQEQFFEEKKKIKFEWSEKGRISREAGTEFHLIEENKIYDQGYKLNPFNGKKYFAERVEKKFDNQSIVDDLSTLATGAYPELLIYNEDLNILGQADDPIVDRKRKYTYLDINDWKTLGEGKNKHVNKTDTSFGKNMIPPMGHVKNGKHERYMLQICIYAYLMELAGYTVRDLAYTSVLNYDINESVLVQLPYKREEAKLMVETFSNLHNEE